MPPVHVMTVVPDLPLWLLDHVLSRTEQALVEAGASHVWIATDLPAIAVMAELALEDPRSGVTS